MHKTVIVFGNPDLPMDSMPLRLVPELEKRLPDIKFHLLDPNEEWHIPKEFVVLDTVQGIEHVTVFHDLKHFAAAPRVSMHDFDALTNLLYLKKLDKVTNVKIVGVPPNLTFENALANVLATLLLLWEPTALSN